MMIRIPFGAIKPSPFGDYGDGKLPTGFGRPDNSPGGRKKQKRLEEKHKELQDKVNQDKGKLKNGGKKDKSFYGHPIPSGRESKMDNFSKHKVAQTLF